MLSFIRRREFWAVLVIFSFSINLAAYSGVFEEGVSYLKKAERARKFGNEKEESEYLQKAFLKFMKCKDDKEKLMLIHTGRLINKYKEIESVAIELVKQKRTQYISMIAKLDVLDMSKKKSLKEYLLSIENRIPFIDNVKLEKQMIYPYRGDLQHIKLTMYATAELSLNIDGNSENIDRLDKGLNSLNFNWQDSYVNKNNLNLKLTSRSEFCEYHREMKVNLHISIPGNLYYTREDFAIRGKEFKREQKEIISREYFSKRVFPGILLAGGTVGIGVLASTLSNEPNYDEYGKESLSNRAWGYIATALVGLIAIAYLKNTFSKKTKNKYKKVVPDRSNIKYNQKLKREINRKKSEIRVKMQLEEENT